MKTVEFKWDLVSGGYDAYENGKINKGADGTYVLAPDVNEALTAHKKRSKVLEDALKLAEVHIEWGDSSLESVHKYIREVLEVKP
jgi:hypothetical protein